MLDVFACRLGHLMQKRIFIDLSSEVSPEFRNLEMAKSDVDRFFGHILINIKLFYFPAMK